jgi:hypothetical protein
MKTWRMCSGGTSAPRQAAASGQPAHCWVLKRKLRPWPLSQCPVKKGIDQLSTASEPRNLGTYTQKILVSEQVWDHTLSNLRELAEARRIEVIELPSFSTEGSLAVEDGEKLTQRVCKSLGRP